MEDDGDCGVASVFGHFSAHLAEEADTKEDLKLAVKALEQASREVHTITQRVHRPGGVLNTSLICSKMRQSFLEVQILVAKLDEKLPPQSYWKYSNMWLHTVSWLSFLGSLLLYLETEQLGSLEDVAGLLGLTTTSTLRLDIEEYLAGLTHLSNELARLAVNCVTAEDYFRPVRIAEFINSLNTGFRQLNLKNDHLRKKFDSIKYDLKKVEEVVYDLSIRGLAGPSKGKEGEKEVQKA